MSEYYFDMETAGLNFNKDEIISIQWQELGLTGEAIGELTILKSWESSEKDILETFLPKIQSHPFNFIFVGKNLSFDFCFLSQRLKKYNLLEFDLAYLYNRIFIDLKPLLIIMNDGRVKDYHKIIPQTNPISNYQIPILFKNEEYDKILGYIKDEANDFIVAYQVFKKEVPLFRNKIRKA